MKKNIKNNKKLYQIRKLCKIIIYITKFGTAFNILVEIQEA